ncbi:MAG: hypothetical protein WCG32_00925 [Actinomycetes bacterium]
MAKLIKLAALSPKHLNLNGDLGNLLVLKKRLGWRGVNSSITHLKGSEDFSEFDFILVGHGSTAAWTQLLTETPGLMTGLVKYIKNGGALLAVASAADLLQPLLTGVEVIRGEWVSKFVQSEAVVGYLNSASKSDFLFWIENSLLTQLHGPLLAKNPALADEIISRNDWSDVGVGSPELKEIDQLAIQSRKIAFES